MKTRKLKLFNGRDWHCKGGHLYVAAYSIKDCAELASAAYRLIMGYPERLDIMSVTVNEVNKYWHKDCWGTSMVGVVPERGVWWGKANGNGMAATPERIL